MYIPPYYRSEDEERMFGFMQKHLFGVLITAAGSTPWITHLPVIVKKEANSIYVLTHMSRANPHWKHFAEGGSTFIFHGPHAYISPSLYSKTENVPTWNYIAVHASGTPEILDAEESSQVLDEMILAYDQAYMAQYQSLPDKYKDGLKKGIVAFRMKVEKLEGKYKLNQNKPEHDQEHVMHTLSSHEDQAARDIAEEMRINLGQ